MDQLDIEIIKNLQQNARTSLRDIGEKLKKPHTTIHSRLKKIEADGIIKDYAAIIHPHKLGLKVGYVIIDTPPEKTREVSAVIAEHPETLHVMRTADGKIIVKIIVEDSADNKGIEDYLHKLCNDPSKICDYPMQAYTVHEIVKYEHAIDSIVLDKRREPDANQKTTKP